MKAIEEIISEKAYSELTELELREVAELAANETEYNQMKRFFESFTEEVQNSYTFEASPSVKSSLDSIFAAKHPVITQDWKKEEVAAAEAPIVPLYKRRSLQVAAVLLLCLGTAPLLFRQETLTITGAKEFNAGATAKAEQSTETKSKIQVKSPISDKAVALADLKEERFVQPVSIEEPAEKKTEYRDDYTAKVSGVTFEAAAPAANHTTQNGLNADLNPNFGTTATYSYSFDESSGATASASGKEMLEWIQAAY